MAYDIGYDAAKTGPAPSPWGSWAQIVALFQRLARDLANLLKAPSPAASPPGPLMVEDLMLRPRLVQTRADRAPGRAGRAPDGLEANAPRAFLNGTLLVWRRDDGLSSGRNVTFRLGLVIGGGSADAAILLLAFSFSR